MPIFWLGPFTVIRSLNHVHGQKVWNIADVNGRLVKLNFWYLKDAEAACAVMNLTAPVSPGDRGSRAPAATSDRLRTSVWESWAPPPPKRTR